MQYTMDDRKRMILSDLHWQWERICRITELMWSILVQRMYTKLLMRKQWNRMYAERLLGELLEQDYPAYIDDSGAYARVQVGRYTDMNQAVAMERRLKRDGYQTVLLKQ